MRAFLLLLLVGVAAGTGLRAQPVAAVDDPTQDWEVGYESGVIWRVTGSATPLSYTVAPQLITVISPLIGSAKPFLGGDLVLRNRFSLLMEPIISGPEHHFFGVSGSGLAEWWDHDRTYCLFLAAGGGFGWLDSRGYEIPGAQGEHFNFNWLAYPGFRFRLATKISASGGVYFQHISNHGLNKVNPGLNAVGPMLGVTWNP